ncbi:hypothetical protein [Desulfovibrio ferrophilus]|uniref:Uncharacterized protein n=1 Tax=Desulfovibrio ferrophilus TaxID=241368 RepID=A0A2Z6AYT6_9BACT|nr:hypothetical protein [Desulfovibrio ferrophilus]BBD08409.1 uncharacterized protein DFE_1683 [Desulfovibrio ferrophilus]
MKRMKLFFGRNMSLLLLFVLAGLLFGWPLITLAEGGQGFALYLTFGATLIIVLLFIVARVREGSDNERNG